MDAGTGQTAPSLDDTWEQVPGTARAITMLIQVTR